MLKGALFLLAVLEGSLAHGQQAQADPRAWAWPSQGGHGLATVDAAPFDGGAAAADDAAREAAGGLRLYARFVEVGAHPATDGRWTEGPDGGALWHLRIRSKGALATELFLTDVHLPPGARLVVFNETGSHYRGVHEAEDVASDGSLAVAILPGEACVLAYHEPAAVRGQGTFRIDKLAHAYRDISTKDSGTCEVDVACAEGVGWETVRDAVVRVRVVVPAGTARCTGTLMNNTARDCRPFVLTAMHCGGGSTEAMFGQYQFYFNHQRVACGVGDGDLGQVLTGCQKRAGSNDLDGEGTAQGSDFLLLELNDDVPTAFHPYYAGWDASGTAVSAGRCIHHPDGDVKKISTFNTLIYSTTWGGSMANTHWRVVWAATANGHGVTEPGSSGAPLLDNARRVIGTLTGGASCCTLNGCGPNTALHQPDYFGKMATHWTGNTNPPAEKLREWLAPGSGLLQLDGSYDPCNAIGIAEHGAVELQVFPDPTSGPFTVRAGHGRWIDRVTVHDLTGRIAYETNGPRSADVHLDASTWPAGVYVLVAWSGGVPSKGRRVVVAR